MRKKLERYQSIEGELTATGLGFGFVVARFNSFITERLLAGALDAVERSGGAEATCDVVWVPGSREIPTAAKETGREWPLRRDCLLGRGDPRRDDPL